MVIMMAEPAHSRTAEPPRLLPRRCHGTLDEVTDSERRALRPIGLTVREAADRTSALLEDLLALPGVQLFQGILPPATGLPRIPHAISSGCHVILVESVAWPPGRYTTMPGGRIHCDGIYIGQSARPLLATIRSWRENLPHGHRIGAIVVVHPEPDGDLVLPRTAGRALIWVTAAEAVQHIRGRLPRQPQPASVRAVAELMAATEPANYPVAEGS